MSFEAVMIVALAVLGVFLLFMVVAPKRRLPAPEAKASASPADPPPEPSAPPDVVALLREADQLIGAGELDRASLLLSQATAVEPERPGLLFVRSRMLHARGEPEQAVKMLERACEGRPDVVSWHCVRGHMLLDLERPDLAREAFDQALELDPDSEDARAGMAEAEGRLSPS